MRIYEIITENNSTLSEGPLLNKIGSGLGKAVRGTAQAIGAAPGAVVGLGQSMKTGYAKGKAFGSGSSYNSGNSGAPRNNISADDVIQTISGMQPAEQKKVTTALGVTNSSAAISNMVNQVAQKTQSSTGGSVQKTATGVRHTARQPQQSAAVQRPATKSQQTTPSPARVKQPVQQAKAAPQQKTAALLKAKPKAKAAV